MLLLTAICPGLRGMAPKLPPLGVIANAVLKTKDGTEMTAQKLWEQQPVFILGIRRPGCGKLQASLLLLTPPRASVACCISAA